MLVCTTYPPGLNLVVTFEKKFKNKPSEVVHQSMRGSNHVESFNSEMVKMGSGNNNSTQLMDSKLMNDITRHNLKRQSVIQGVLEPPTTYVVKMGSIRQMRKLVKLPNIYLTFTVRSPTLKTCLHRQALWDLRP